MFFLALVFIPMEKVFPAKKDQRIIRRQWILDICYFFGQYLFWSGIILSILYYCHNWIQSIIPEYFVLLINKQALWLQAIEVLLLSDIIIYWGHRFQHKYDILWRFHKVHHSAIDLDWLAAHREHPFDTIYTVGLINLPAFIFGFNLNSIIMVIAFRGIWAIFIHSNVRLSFGPIKKLIGSPDLHHWHHDIERNRGNYGNVSPIMDVIFGTYFCPNHEPTAFGIKEQFSTTYVGQLFHPLVPKYFHDKIKTIYQKVFNR
jgi:sterol desaturase/sphingolipid hydroxylase (fatty acid hydroxylase superfamily)